MVQTNVKTKVHNIKVSIFRKNVKKQMKWVNSYKRALGDTVQTNGKTKFYNIKVSIFRKKCKETNKMSKSLLCRKNGSLRNYIPQRSTRSKIGLVSWHVYIIKQTHGNSPEENYCNHILSSSFSHNNTIQDALRKPLQIFVVCRLPQL